MKSIFIVIILSFLIYCPCFAQDIDLSELTKLNGESSGDAAGDTIASTGDVNADGYPDLLISSTSEDTGGENAGAVYLIYGKSEIIATQSLSQADVKFISQTASERIGSSLAAGDVNGDGYDDILISTIYEDTGGENAGAIYLIYGAASLSNTVNVSQQAQAKFIGEDANDNAGKGLAAGDVNGDGYDDILIGASFADDGGGNSGVAYLIYGTNSLSGNINLSSASAKFIGEAANNFAGWSIAVDNLNSDNYEDILLSAFANSNAGGNAAGAVYLIQGSASSLSGDINLASATAKFIGERASDYAGRAVKFASDVNGDGYNDFLVGAVGDDTGASGAGAAYLVHGSNSLSGTISLTNAQAKFAGEEAINDFGESLAGVGDADNDGYGDILIGAYQNDEGGEIAGAAYLIYGSDSLSGNYAASADNIIKFIGEEAGDFAGESFSAIGDLNQDGYAEIAIDASGYGEAGAVYLAYLYIDADGDAVPGDQGLFSGTDCNDNDAAVSAEQTYYLDADADGLGDPNNTTTICSAAPPSGYVANDDEDDINNNGAPDIYENLDPADEAIAAASISSVVGAKNGRIKVTYANNSVYKYAVFHNTTKKKTKVRHYRHTGYYLVLQAHGKKLALVNVYNGQTIKKKKIASVIKYKYNALELFKFRKKYFVVVTSKKKDGQVRLVISRIIINKEKFGLKDMEVFMGKNIAPQETKKNKNKILLKNKSKEVLEKYLITKKYELKRL